MKAFIRSTGLAAGILAAAAGLADALPTFSRAEPPRQREAVAIQNPGFESAAGWVNAEGGPFAATADAHSGSRAGRLAGSMVKGEFIPLGPGEELNFEFFAKVDNLCTVNAELAYFDADRNWLRRGSGPIARGDQYSWQHVAGRHEITDPEVRFVILQFYGSGEIDDVTAWKFTALPDTGDRAKAKQTIELAPGDSQECFYLADQGIAAWISRSTGMAVQVLSLEPTPKVIQPAGTNSMQLYLKSRTPGGPDGDFNRVAAVESHTPEELVFRLTSDDPALARLAEARIAYRLAGGELAVKAEIICLQDDAREYQAGFRSVFRADEWQRNIYMSFPIQARSVETAVRATFLYGIDDNSVKNMGTGYPCAVLEGEDRYLLWGSRDLGRFTMLTPNDIPWRLPSQQLNPTRLKAGETLSFESFYALFPKRGHELTQVMRRYVRTMYSSNPLTAGVLQYRPDDRYFTEGAFAWYHPGAVPPGYDGWRDAMKERHAENVWYSWWTNWDEVCPTEGEWVTYDGRFLSAEGQKKEIAYMQEHGLNVYLYFRQFLVEEGTYEDRAPCKSWLGRDRDGKRIPFIDFPFPRPELLNGLEKIRWTMADFGNPDYREWYLDMVKRSVNFYRPRGVAWDMNFGSAYSVSHPETGIGHGTLWVQAMIHDWLKEQYPEMRIATNEAIANPSSLFADAILIEGAWDVAGKSELDYQVARAFDATLFSLQLTDDYIIQGVPMNDLKPYKYCLMRVRGERVAAAGLGFGELVQNGFVPDGSWQWIALPLTSPGYRMLAVNLTADNSGRAWLELDEAKLTAGADPAAPGKTVWDRNTPAENFVLFGKWSHNLPSSGGVARTADGLRFTADQPGGTSGMWLDIAPAKAKWLKTNLKVLALGAICSDAQIPALEELNAFSGRLAAMRHLSDRKVIYDAPAGVYGTLWARDGRIAGAIYNESGDSRAVALRLDRAALPENGKALETGNLRLRLVDADGQIHDAAGFTLTPRAGDFALAGTFAPGQLLIFE